jgi:hypothetical protein
VVCQLKDLAQQECCLAADIRRTAFLLDERHQRFEQTRLNEHGKEEGDIVVDDIQPLRRLLFVRQHFLDLRTRLLSAVVDREAAAVEER